jgi:aryl-alcohol dehydrogenase-like predicted oxidoreductase
MRYRALKGTNLQLSELGFGTWTVSTGWWGTYTDDQARDLVRAAIDRGINYIDTADAYGNGRGESFLQPVLKDHRDLIIGTKFGYDFYNNPERPRGTCRRGSSASRWRSHCSVWASITWRSTSRTTRASMC